MNAKQEKPVTNGATTGPCPRCKLSPATQKARGEPMCIACFQKYIGGKVARRLEPYKVRSGVAQRKMFLALSLGVSSLTLLHILAQQLQTQRSKIGRCAYELTICIFDDESVFQQDENGERRREDEVRVREVKEMFFNDREEWGMITDVRWRSTKGCFEALGEDDEEFRNLLRSCQSEVGAQLQAGRRQSYEAFIASLPSASARSDINAVLTRRFLIREAQDAGCDTMLWGDSTTRLAERTLAEAAKGRGFSLPWQTADGQTPHNLAFLYPMRDLLRKEIAAFAELIDPPLTALAKPESTYGVPQASSKDATIDALMAQYFTSVEENFPSIVANVVRTSNRLKSSDSGNAGQQRCELCALPVAQGTDGLHGWAGSQQDDAPETQTGFYCYGCARSIKGRRIIT